MIHSPTPWSTECPKITNKADQNLNSNTTRPENQWKIKMIELKVSSKFRISTWIGPFQLWSITRLIQPSNSTCLTGWPSRQLIVRDYLSTSTAPSSTSNSIAISKIKCKIFNKWRPRRTWKPFDRRSSPFQASETPRHEPKHHICQQELARKYNSRLCRLERIWRWRTRRVRVYQADGPNWIHGPSRVWTNRLI